MVRESDQPIGRSFSSAYTNRFYTFDCGLLLFQLLFLLPVCIKFLAEYISSSKSTKIKFSHLLELAIHQFWYPIYMLALCSSKSKRRPLELNRSYFIHVAAKGKHFLINANYLIIKAG